jgi:ATP-dependent DNA ligase
MTEPWLPTDVDEEGAQLLLKSPEWLLQRKEDGVHMHAEIEAGTIRAIFARSNRALTLPPHVESSLLKMFPAGSAITGEVIPTQDRAVLFDLLRLEGIDLRPIPTERRYSALAECWNITDPSKHVEVVECAITVPDKVKLYAQLRAEGAEGAIFKKRDAPYGQGRPATGGTMRRRKFRKRMDVILMRRRDDRRSFEIYVYSDTALHNLGSVSAHTFYDQLQPGGVAIAECEYLYSGPPPGYHLVQPTIVRLRNDKPAAECTLDQVQVGPRWRK